MNAPRDFIAIACETTGLDICSSRVVELGCIEVGDGELTGRHLHAVINPEMLDQHQMSTEFHGLSSATLDKANPFSKHASQFVELISGRTVVLAGSTVDHVFFDAELARAGFPPLSSIAESVIDGPLLLKSAESARGAVRHPITTPGKIALALSAAEQAAMAVIAILSPSPSIAHENSVNRPSR